MECIRRPELSVRSVRSTDTSDSFPQNRVPLYNTRSCNRGVRSTYDDLVTSGWSASAISVDMMGFQITNNNDGVLSENRVAYIRKGPKVA